MSKLESLISYMLAHPWSTKQQIRQATHVVLSAYLSRLSKTHALEQRPPSNIYSRAAEYRLRPLTPDEIAENSKYYDPHEPGKNSLWVWQAINRK